MLNLLNYDFAAIPDGGRITLYPAEANFVQQGPSAAIRRGNGFYLDGSTLKDGPDYTMGDIRAFCEGWEPLPHERAGSI